MSSKKEEKIMKTAQERAEKILTEAADECSAFIKERVDKKRKEIEALSKEELVNLVVKTYALNLAKSEEFKNEAGKIMSDAFKEDTNKHGDHLSKLIAKEKLARHTVERILVLLKSYDPKAIDVIIANGIIAKEDIDEFTKIHALN